MKRIIYLTLMVLLLTTNLRAQELTYDLTGGNMHLGTITVTRQVEGNIERYLSKGEIEVTIIFTFRIGSLYKAIFEDGSLIASSTRNLRNDEVTAKADGFRKGDTYINVVEGDTMRTPLPIDYVLITSYFREPVGRSQAYTERRGVYLPITDLGDHRYKMITYSDKPVYYTYEDGICTKIELHHFLGTLHFTLQK